MTTTLEPPTYTAQCSCARHRRYVSLDEALGRLAAMLRSPDVPAQDKARLRVWGCGCCGDWHLGKHRTD